MFFIESASARPEDQDPGVRLGRHKKAFLERASLEDPEDPLPAHLQADQPSSRILGSNIPTG